MCCSFTLRYCLCSFGWTIALDSILFIFIYVSLATYDHLYNCSDKMQTGTYGPGGPMTAIFKPGATTAKDMQLQKRNVYIFHLFILPLLLYVAIKHKTAPTWMFQVIGGLAAIGIIYHGVRFSHYLFSKEPEKVS